MARRRLHEPEWVAARRELLSYLDDRVEARRDELEDIEKSFQRLSKIETQGHREDERKRRLGWLSNVIIATGLSAGVIAFGGKVAEDYYFGDESEVCKEAYEVMRDERMNPGIPPRVMTPYLEKQARNAMYCSDRKVA